MANGLKRVILDLQLSQANSTWAQFLEGAIAAEEAGFDTVWVLGSPLRGFLHWPNHAGVLHRPRSHGRAHLRTLLDPCNTPATAT